MSLANAVPDGLRKHECKRTALPECPPVLHVPEKNEVQDAVSLMKGLQLKTSIGEDTTLHFSVWNNGTKEAMFMHVMATLDAIKKRGHFQAYKKPRCCTWPRKKQQSRQRLVYPCFTEPAMGQKNPRSLLRRPRKPRM
jgi:hypothetical protein